MDLIDTVGVDPDGGAAVEVLGERSSLTVVARTAAAARRDELIADVRRGLGAPRKWLPARWFYDERGSELFEQITALPEYYQTRTEAAILAAASPRIAEVAASRQLVELGAGTCTKTRILLRAMLDRGLSRFVPVDVSEAALTLAARSLTAEFSALYVHGVIADFHQALQRLQPEPRRTIAFLGSTIGNLLPHERVELFSAVRARLGSDGSFLLGVDLVKPEAELFAAYNDSAGVTAEFNRNLLHVLNRELGADFDVPSFAHWAPYDASLQRIEMHLRSGREQWVDIPGARLRVQFAAGETVLTEISAKFTRARVEAELAMAGMRSVEWFSDERERFALCLARPR